VATIEIWIVLISNLPRSHNQHIDDSSIETKRFRF